MVARKFCVRHNGADFDVDYDTDDGLEVFKFQLFSLTSVPPDEQKILGVDTDRVVSEDSDLAAISDRLRLVSIDEEENVENPVEENQMDQASNSDACLLSDEELARILQDEEEALMMQQYVVGQNKGEMEGRLRPYIDQVRLYEDLKRQEAARKTVPVEELEEKALVSLAREGNFTPTKIEESHAFLLQLLFWFKRSFSWVNAPACEGCGGETVNQGMGNPLPAELQYGASRVELYRCRYCVRTTRFPRYNDPLKLLQTRRGRCGEWANCFTLYCRAFGYDSRLVLDFTDHVWTECFTQHIGRWMHLDPCEAVYDRPLLYEKGWNKKLNYAFGISRDGIYDVTKRYTRKWHEVLSRRIMITESDLSNLIFKLTKECQRNCTPQEISALEDRDRKEREEIEKKLHSTEDCSVSLPGRQSGDKEWRLLRGEITDSGSNSLSSSSCPVRNCVDEHVTRIYNAFFPLISHMVENSVPQTRAIEVLSTFRELLVKIGNMPFKSRRVSLDSISKGDPLFVNQLLPSFTDLLDALGLKFDNLEGKIKICLAGDPVKASLALPVVLVALDDTILNIKLIRNFDKNILALPLLKVNRIHSGSVLASGEELPFGISKSAFDGTYEVKWEEPNGAKGCWLIYKVPDNQMKELVGYELMSANDVPERDPKDWVLEGSNDGGLSWNVLDKQNSQMFEARFQRKTYILKPTGVEYNAFRFRFLAVRDVSNTRFQVGSIDLYARSNE